MKQLLFSLVLLFCVGSAFGQTAERLIKKYKAFPNAEYKDNTEKHARVLLKTREKGLMVSIQKTTTLC